MRVFVVFCSVSLWQGYSRANEQDCWDQRRLERLKQDMGKDVNDPGLSKFALMVRCLMQEQGQGPKSQLGAWEELARGQFPPNWNQKGGINEDQLRRNFERIPERMNNPGSGRQDNPMSQPSPGVHPDDWDRDGNRRRDPDPDYARRDDWNQNNIPEDEDRRRRKNERRRQKEERRRLKEQEQDDMYQQQAWPPVEMAGPAPGQQPQPGDNGSPISAGSGRTDDFVLITDEDAATMSLHRKYGYAVMALCVVVLAVLMVSTIFCCNSSNSTMNQPTTHQGPIPPMDNYSLYSYKAGMGVPAVSDTLRSGTLRTGSLTKMDTLPSTGTLPCRGSPQYRVSDIDPDFERRFKDQQY